MDTDQRFDAVRRQTRSMISILVAVALVAGCPNSRLQTVDDCILEARTGERTSCWSPDNRPGVGVCRSGYYACIDGALDRTTCLDEEKPSPEVCDGLDNDCFGGVDDNITSTNDPRVGIVCGESKVPANAIGPGKLCKLGKNACLEGVVYCDGLIEPKDEVCDGVDNDCNGFVDDSVNLYEPCQSPDNPRLVGECGPGMRKCVNGNMDAGPCEREIKPAPEVCDGKDNDCDGTKDNGCNETEFLVRLEWNNTGDVDLHLHNGKQTKWFYDYAPGTTPTGDDCFYGNLNPDWGVKDSGVDDPKLDIDNTAGSGPENIRIEKSVVGEIYTIGVHNFRGADGRIATVSIFCGKTATPKIIYKSCPLSLVSTWCASDNFWKVATVVFDSTGVCVVTEINTYSPSAVRSTRF